MEKQRLYEKVRHGTPRFPMACFTTRPEQPSFQIQLHWHNSMEIMQMEQGTAEVTIGAQTFQAHAGDLFFINPQQLHRILAEDNALVYHTFIFPLHALAFQTGDNAQAYLEPLIQNTMHFPVQPAEEDRAWIADLLRRILTAAEQKAAGYELMVKALLLQLIAELLRRKRFLAVPQSPSKKSQQLKQMLEYIQQHSESDLTIPTMAETFHLSEKYFSRYFRTATGQNFTAYLNTVRIEKARVLLRETDETVLEIALNCGYGSISYFNRVFRQQIGMSPLQYRTSAR